MTVDGMAASSARAALQAAVAYAEAAVQGIRQIERVARQAVWRAQNRGRMCASAANKKRMALVGSFSTSPPAGRRIARAIVGRNKGVSTQSRLEQANRLAEWTLHAPDARAMATAELAALPDSKNVFVAAGLVAEAAVVDWLARRNLTGVAVSTAPGLRKLRELWPAAGRQRRFLQFFIRLRHSRTHVRNWALRFRRRWGLRWARLPARADLPEERCARRVGASFFLQKSRVGSAVLGAKNGSIFWTHFWPP